MEEWVILQQPAVLLLCGAALLLSLFERKYRSTRGIFFWVSGTLAILAGAWGLLEGASLREIAAVFMIFWLVSTGGST